MSLSIMDGEGNGTVAGVNGRNRLKVQAISDTGGAEATDRGDSYNINSGSITLTSSNKSAILYLKNNENQDLHITGTIVGMSPSTGGTAETIPVIEVIRNPTAGTIITSAVPVDINSNRNYGSSKEFSANAYRGAEGATITNGESHLIFFSGAGARLVTSINEVLTKGDSIGVNLTPQDSNTNMIIYCAIVCHLKDNLAND